MIDIESINFNKSAGLVPAIITDANTGSVLMLGYMNKESLQMTLDTGLITFFSRSKNRMWQKGEESGNVLHLKNIKLDCDKDTLLIDADPAGPVCHQGTFTCWGEENNSVNIGFLLHLQNIIQERAVNKSNTSYTATLLGSGIQKVAQKVGEEAVEVVIEAMGDKSDRFLDECADLLFHFLILLKSKNQTLQDVVQILQQRHSK
ncbi:MAG TPA: bifunctional phosphoribosyl-AMP cyclohydrolase/phosphoribosyl-ATP diphosphatase HisIE [Saprospiraceae bacterium]|nr:bifunctional phosphoribosyl-AMP cyclohydrolase/phosphoribosyl-ATP diphosphatase HisIE [Saprospiraceae bacterium]